jgi:hypothetical protein
MLKSCFVTLRFDASLKMPQNLTKSTEFQINLALSPDYSLESETKTFPNYRLWDFLNFFQVLAVSGFQTEKFSQFN